MGDAEKYPSFAATALGSAGQAAQGREKATLDVLFPSVMWWRAWLNIGTRVKT